MQIKNDYYNKYYKEPFQRFVNKHIYHSSKYHFSSDEKEKLHGDLKVTLAGIIQNEVKNSNYIKNYDAYLNKVLKIHLNKFLAEVIDSREKQKQHKKYLQEQQTKMENSYKNYAYFDSENEIKEIAEHCKILFDKAGLTIKESAVILLTYMDYPPMDICKLLNITRTNKRQIFCRARKKLQQILEPADVLE